jgi:acyl-CoA thioester hydrolase
MVARFDFSHRVAPGDIDELGHAGNYHYIRWLQHAAVAHSTANGWPSRRYEELGAGWVVRSHQITYLKPAFEGDDVIITTWVADMKPATSLRRYEIRRRDGAFINYARERPVRIPPEVANCFEVVAADAPVKP